MTDESFSGQEGKIPPMLSLDNARLMLAHAKTVNPNTIQRPEDLSRYRQLYHAFDIVIRDMAGRLPLNSYRDAFCTFQRDEPLQEKGDESLRHFLSVNFDQINLHIKSPFPNKRTEKWYREYFKNTPVTQFLLDTRGVYMDTYDSGTENTFSFSQRPFSTPQNPSQFALKTSVGNGLQRKEITYSTSDGISQYGGGQKLSENTCMQTLASSIQETARVILHWSTL